MSRPEDYHKIPSPADNVAGRNHIEAPSTNITKASKAWRPVGANIDETPAATLSRFSRRVIAEDGNAYTPEDMPASVPVAQALDAREPKIPQAVFASNSEALNAGVPFYALYRKPNGEVGWVYPDLDAEAVTYQNTTGISDTAAIRLSNFLRGLTTLGIRTAFVDGGVYRKELQSASGSILQSIRGSANVNLTGSPVRQRHGVYFSGLGQYGVTTIPSSVGPRSFVGLHYGMLDNLDTRSQVIFQLRQNLHFATVQTNGSNPGQSVSYGGTAVRILPDSTWSRATSRMVKSALRDDAAAGATSFSAIRLPGQTSYARGNAQGEPSHTLNQLRICVTGNSNLSTIDHTTERVVPGWLLFNRALTDSEELGLNTLLGTTLFPRWRFVWEGDSITNDMQQRAANKEAWAGGNFDWHDQWAGGETAAHGVAQLGTSTGLNDSNLANDMPTVAFIAFGTNDLGSPSLNHKTVSQFHGELRTLWAYARARGAKVVANTVFQGFYISDNGREADRIALNELIRADAGIYYDLLCDRDAWAMAATATRPVYDDTNIIRPGGVHLNLQPGMGSDQLTALLSNQLISAGFIP